MYIEPVLDILIKAGLDSADVSGKEKQKKLLERMTQSDCDELMRMCGLHQIWGVVSAGLKKYGDAQVNGTLRSRMQQAEEKVAFQYYTMLSFTTYVLSVFREEGIQCYLLKGIALNALYPKEEMRKLSDADIYIPDMRDYRRADGILKKRGFKKEKGLAEFHSGYVKEMGGKHCLLELHWRPCNMMRNPDSEKYLTELFGNLEYRPDICRIAGVDIPVLPATENAFQLLLHMFQHFIREGFGLRMLCDWCVFLRHKGSQIDDDRLLAHMEGTAITGFAWSLTTACITHFGLDGTDIGWLQRIDGKSYEKCDEMVYRDVMNGGEFGQGERSRVTVLDGGSFLPLSYVRAVHDMMRSRFPKLRKLVIAWPVLWAAAIVIFLINNRKLDRGSTSDVIKSARARSALFRKMKIFRKKGRKKK